MSALATLQNDFQNHLLIGDEKIASAISIPLDSEDGFLKERLNIYQNAYELRFIEALSSNFPTLHDYIGEDLFEVLAKSYIKAAPSNFRSIRWYGNTFSNFLKKESPADFYYLSELAEWEWKMTLSFDAMDAPLLQLEDMAAIPQDAWADMIIKLQPSVFRQDLVWNVVSIWEAMMSDNSAEVLAVKEPDMSLWVLWRDADYMNRFYQLDKDEAWAIDAVLAGNNFGDICEGLCQWHADEEVGQRAASFLQAWIESGLIAK